MSMIIDSRQTYFDADGVRLSGGRLRFYVWGTTTPATVYSAIDHQTPIQGVIQLTSAGWTPFEVYSTQDLDVRADKFIGLDEYGVETYQEVKSFRYIPGGTGSAGGDTVSMAVVESIADLRELPATFASCIVLGYHSKGDCPARVFNNVAASAATDNSGTVVGSTVDPTMRWIWTPDCSEIDCRTFGVIESASTTINSQLATFLGYCDTSRSVAYFVKGVYQLAPGSLTSNACIHAQNGVQLRRGQLLDSSEANWYHLTLTNPGCRFEGTFAGTCVRMILNGDNWQDTVVPLSAFSFFNRGFDRGTAVFHLVLDSDPSGKVLTFQEDCSFSAVSVPNGCVWPVSLDAGAQVKIDHLEGPGKISFNQSIYAPEFRELRTSLVSSRVSYCMAKTTEVIHLDRAVNAHTGMAITAYVEASGAGALRVPDASCSMTGGYGGKPNFLTSDYGINVGHHTVKQEFFASTKGLVRTWNISTEATGDLDLGGAVCDKAIERQSVGKVMNGTIAGVSSSCAEIRLDRVTVTGPVESTFVEAVGSTFSNMGSATFPNMTASQFTKCTITSGVAVNASDAIWQETSFIDTDIKSIGGGARLRDVFCKRAYLIPDNTGYFKNFSWVGGNAYRIDFDASQCTTTGEFLSYNVTIKDLAYLQGNINALNNIGGSKRWSHVGHYNVQICNNEGVDTRATIGSKRVALELKTYSSASSSWWLYMDTKTVFRFRPDLAEASPIELRYDFASLVFSKDKGSQWDYPRGCQYIAHVNDNYVYCDKINKSYVGIRRFNDETSPATGDLINFSWVIYK